MGLLFPLTCRVTRLSCSSESTDSPLELDVVLPLEAAGVLLAPSVQCHSPTYTRRQEIPGTIQWFGAWTLEVGKWDPLSCQRMEAQQKYSPAHCRWFLAPGCACCHCSVPGPCPACPPQLRAQRSPPPALAPGPACPGRAGGTRLTGS